MNSAQLSKVIRERARALRNADLAAPTIGQLADDSELLNALARVVEGIPLNRAFGSPGDWGYNQPIGRALRAKEEPHG